MQRQELGRGMYKEKEAVQSRGGVAQMKTMEEKRGAGEAELSRGGMRGKKTKRMGAENETWKWDPLPHWPKGECMQLAELPSKRREDSRRRGELSRSRRCRILAEYYNYIMPYKKESGAQGRKRRKIETEQQAKLAGSLHRFLVSTAEITAGPSAAPQETHNPDPVSVDIPVPALEAETVSSKDVYTQPNLPENIDQKVYTDIGYWPETMDETLKTELVRARMSLLACLLGDHIRTVIFQNIIKAKYFAIMFDSTPDISHTDQMSQVIRYVHIEDSGVHVTESFIDFIQLNGKSDDVITKQICDKLQADGLKLEHCYGQGYDNAATMAGHISGVQKRILDMNPKALFVPCNNHSLNLAGMHAVGVGTKSVTFFGTVEKVYAFFSSSTHRWDILKKHVPIRVKRSCNTRWSSKHEAVCVLAEHTEKIIDALEALRDGPEETSETRGDAGSLLVCIMTYVFFSFLNFWNPVLTEVNDTQIYLQQEGLALDQCV
ncbi:hypothetical protein NDU88_010715 [Pleurodeles waltl]|uniref:DUF4371 domain-containing protein n=1 Tax=Pleurodeles waltl TaxID=8319 RepID=A0AAV7QYP2_PLEWA|nr:hypothetical protein NDU88_010715 [Pleurodeles waltl]